MRSLLEDDDSWNPGARWWRLLERDEGTRRLASCLLAFVVGASGLGVASRAAAQPYSFSHFAGSFGGRGTADGTGSAARFGLPEGVVVDGAGTVYVADTQNHTIRKVAPGGVVTTLAGLGGSRGAADGTGSAARFYNPAGVAVDAAGTVYVADTYNNTIRRVTPDGVVTTIAGRSSIFPTFADGTGSAARFNSPAGLAIDMAGVLYVADSGNHRIRKVTRDGIVTTLASGFAAPNGVAVDAAGNVYVADTYSHTIRKVTPGGAVTTLAGLAGVAGSTDGVGSAARFRFPEGVAVDAAGTVYVADSENSIVRTVLPDGTVTTLAGVPHARGSEDGVGGAARFDRPRGIGVDAGGTVFIADTQSHTIRTVTPGGVVTTRVGWAAVAGSVNGTGSAARFNFPKGVAVDAAHTVYVADRDNHVIRKVTAAGVVTVLAGQAGVAGGVDGTGGAARFDRPEGVAVDTAGTIYVADTGTSTIRRVTPAGEVTTIAGLTGAPGYADGTGSAARFNEPRGLAVDSGGNLVVADSSNHRIRKVTPGGVVTTLPGGYSFPSAVAVDAAGTVYIGGVGVIQTVSPLGPSARWPVELCGSDPPTGPARLPSSVASGDSRAMRAARCTSWTGTGSGR